MTHIRPALLVLISVLSVSCATHPVPSLTQTYNGKPVRTQASHGAGGSTAKVDGIYLGRRYFQPPSGRGLAHIDVYGQR